MSIFDNGAGINLKTSRPNRNGSFLMIDFVESVISAYSA